MADSREAPQSKRSARLLNGSAGVTGATTADGPLPEHSFALCLTHDVDRPYKRLHHALYYAVTERDPSHLWSVVGTENPYWQFDTVREIEQSLGVRSAFYFLDEPDLMSDLAPRAWADTDNWVQQLGRYDVADPAIAEVITDLDEGGWEVGLHGSYHAATDVDRLRAEKRRLESVLGHSVRGIRQHYLRLEMPETWVRQESLGFDYDASLGSSTEYGFEYGYGLRSPLAEPFVVFPLALMESALPDPDSHPDRAWTACRDLLEEAADNDAILTALWHPRYFSQEDFPGYARLYRNVIEWALDHGAWVGTPAALLDRLGDADLDTCTTARTDQ